MIENFPRDHTQLRDEEEAILRALYDRFDTTSDAVDGQTLVVDVYKQIIHPRSAMQTDAMRQYMYRRDPEDKWVPTLRAALRLGKKEDLTKANSLYQALHDSFAAQVHEISRQKLLEVCGDEVSLRRMALLFGRESFASLQNLLSGGAQAWISEDILEWPTLRDYLLKDLRRRGSKNDLDAGGALPQVKVTLSRIHISNFRSIERATLDNLGNFTALAGPNNAGKSNLLRALRFASQAATAGASQAVEQEGGAHTVFRQQMPRGARLEIDLGLKMPSQVSSEVEGRYHIALSRESRRPVVSEVLERQGTEIINQAGDTARIAGDTNGAEDLYLGRGESALSALRDRHKHRTAIGIREGLAAWGFFNFEAGAIRSGPGYTRASHRHHFLLAPDGTNLPTALSELGRDDPEALRAIAKTFHDYVPEITDVSVGYPLSGDPVIALQEEGLTDPLTHSEMSDGMARLLAIAYIALHPEPPPLVCIEEPENALYPRLIEAALDLLRALSRRSQVIITTHSVTLLNLLAPEEVVFVKRGTGVTELNRLSTRADVVALLETFGVGDQLRMGAVEGGP